MRVEWDLEGFLISKDEIGSRFAELLGEPFKMKWDLKFSEDTPRMAIFVSKSSHCLYDLLARYQAGELKLAIPIIISNHQDLESVAAQFKIPFHHLPVNKENKEQQEKKELELLAHHRIDFIVLARYMQILSPAFSSAYPNRIINIHHSFLPAFAGARPYHAAHSRGVKIIGATSHYVTSDLDEGPIIDQDVIRISHHDTVESLMQKGRDIEKIVLSRAVKAHVERKTMGYKNKTIVFA
jgi:formyltetrahydrofolate deformylase